MVSSAIAPMWLSGDLGQLHFKRDKNNNGVPHMPDTEHCGNAGALFTSEGSTQVH